MTLSGGSGASSGSGSGSSHGTWSRSSMSLEEAGDMELQARMDLKRKRRMESNRKSARMSRLRKQQHLDDLTTQVNQLKTENQQLTATLNITAQSYLAAEAQNSVLHTQKVELKNRLSALHEIIFYMNANQLANVTPTTYPSSMMMTAPPAANTYPSSSMMAAAAPGYDVFSEFSWSSGMQMMQQPIDLLYQC